MPINLTALFNKSYLPYWFDKNKDEKKEIIAYYLSGKSLALPKYLKRAEELLFFSKDIEIQLKHKCGGNLVESEGSKYIFDSWNEDDEYDEEEYELNLECLKCRNTITKIVGRNYFKQQI